MGLFVFQSTFGEGEKACSYLNLIDKCDAIISNDSDAFLYGCKCLYKNFKLNKNVC
jgi:hypothetical protein